MAKQQKKGKRRAAAKPKPLLVLKVTGPDIRTGRIPVPDLLVICQHAQSAVNRQAEAMEGRQTLRPGPKIGKVRQECTLDLVSLGQGSAVLGFDQSKAQATLPQMQTLGLEAITRVGESIHALSKGRGQDVDAGVLDSLKNMGELFSNGVRSIQWIVPGRPGRKKLAVTINRKVQARVIERLKPPVTRRESVDGVLEMADFKQADQKCRIHPNVGTPITCTFAPELADEVYTLLRQPVRVEGAAKVNAQTKRTEEIAITSVKPLDPLLANSGNFYKGWTFEQLVHMQAVEPLGDPKALAGGWPDDEDPDDVLLDIYQQRD